MIKNGAVGPFRPPATIQKYYRCLKKGFSMAKRSKGASARTKGHSFERDMAAALRCKYPDARRQLEYHAADARGVDLQNTGPYRIQCKRGRKWASLAAIKEVTADEVLGEVPVLITQGDRERILVCLPFEEFLRLINS